MMLRKFRDADGDVWEEQLDGAFRFTNPDGGYQTEIDEDTLGNWWGPLTEVTAP